MKKTRKKMKRKKNKKMKKKEKIQIKKTQDCQTDHLPVALEQQQPAAAIVFDYVFK